MEYGSSLTRLGCRQQRKKAKEKKKQWRGNKVNRLTPFLLLPGYPAIHACRPHLVFILSAPHDLVDFGLFQELQQSSFPAAACQKRSHALGLFTVPRALSSCHYPWVMYSNETVTTGQLMGRGSTNTPLWPALLFPGMLAAGNELAKVQDSHNHALPPLRPGSRQVQGTVEM